MAIIGRHRLFLLSAAGKSGRTVPIGAALTDDVKALCSE